GASADVANLTDSRPPLPGVGTGACRHPNPCHDRRRHRTCAAGPVRGANGNDRSPLPPVQPPSRQNDRYRHRPAAAYCRLPPELGPPAAILAEVLGFDVAVARCSGAVLGHTDGGENAGESVVVSWRRGSPRGLIRGPRPVTRGH